ncbi:MAG: CorA family divalent cation transporter [Acidimicrobiia bacterium]
MDRVARGHHSYIDEDLFEYLRDVHGHLLRIAQEVTSFRELLASVLDANLAQVGVRQNEDMRRISAWVAAAAVPTLISGIFGMNFARIPGSTEPSAFGTVLAVMIEITAALHRMFRRSGWL